MKLLLGGLFVSGGFVVGITIGETLVLGSLEASAYVFVAGLTGASLQTLTV